ncbi:MAG: UTP--glucose-1-phosphate uridylyltransferase [Spirochaetales bacterium]|uniref:UTP--glucose-1-phosphate uridylyltransferase n=1 Tax=Candidatus Thalassospirochaeta sargassi TaxID=3119039 RepID=A0AAJ1IK24_9SPIO|nr:UTP--glucose-1-phosphate uridylyltransferase [Spirochaetales bacterium]
MDNKYIDLNLSEDILHNFNNGMYDNVVPVEVEDIPGIDGNDIIDRANMKSWSCDLNEACDNLRKVNPELREYLFGTVYGKVSTLGGSKTLTLDVEDLKKIGVQLYPYIAYGILNGGSATSYVDGKKNEALNPQLMRLYNSLFEKSSKKAAGKAKGITPAFTNPDGTGGPSFIELKLRALLIENLRYRINIDGENELFSGDSEDKKNDALFPMFQMTSVYNDKQIAGKLSEYGKDPLIAELISATGVDITRVLTGIQPMLAAFTHSKVGKPKQFFTNAWGRDGEMLPIPGGHGQNFIILSEIYQYLYRDLGKRFVYLGNVDNIGNMPDPVSIALTALSGRDASFEFAFRTPVDVKGGILVRDQHGMLNCADIGPAVSREEVDRQEASGKKILYNCATGLFNLEYLTNNLDLIIKNLPMRITDQNKDAGMYSQAEQVTWEIIGMIEKPLILGVNKYDRYLAAKLLLESLMTSGLMLNHEDYPSHEDPSKDFKLTAGLLNEGLKKNLESVYGMKETEEGWKALSIDELRKTLKG